MFHTALYGPKNAVNFERCSFESNCIFPQKYQCCISDVVFIQVPFKNKTTSATGKQFRSYFGLSNEPSNQVCEKKSVIIFCYFENMLTFLRVCSENAEKTFGT